MKKHAKYLRLRVLLPTLLAFGWAGGLAAQSGTAIYVHGFLFTVKQSETTGCHDKTTCPSYWAAVESDPNWSKVFVGHDGRFDPIVLNSDRGVMRTLDLLNKYCRRDQGKQCRIVNHSMGGLITGYVLDKFNNDNKYNILYVSSLVSAEGGSELANVGKPILNIVNTLTFGLSDFLLNFPSAVGRLTVSAARGSYDHNRTNGTGVYHIAGDKSNALNVVFPGKHDNVLAMHSTCSYRDVRAFTYCGTTRDDSKYWDWCRNGNKWYHVPYPCQKTRTTFYYAHDGHYPHPGFSNQGVSKAHLDFPNEIGEVFF